MAVRFEEVLDRRAGPESKDTQAVFAQLAEDALDFTFEDHPVAGPDPPAGPAQHFPDVQAGRAGRPGKQDFNFARRLIGASRSALEPSIGSSANDTRTFEDEAIRRLEELGPGPESP